MDSRTWEKYAHKLSSTKASGVLDSCEIARGTLTLEYVSHMHGRVYFVRIVQNDGKVIGSAPMISLDIPSQIFEQQRYFQ